MEPSDVVGVKWGISGHSIEKTTHRAAIHWAGQIANLALRLWYGSLLSYSNTHTHHLPGPENSVKGERMNVSL